MRHLTRMLSTMLLLCAPLFAASAQAVSDSASIQAAELDYGLHIVSYPAHSDEFTGLALEDGKAIPVKGKTLEMSFNLFNRPDNVFGCIFRIITDKGDNVDLMYTADLQDARKLILVTGDQVHFIATEIPMEQWFPVRIGLNTKDGTIDLDYTAPSSRSATPGRRARRPSGSASACASWRATPSATWLRSMSGTSTCP